MSVTVRVVWIACVALVLGACASEADGNDPPDSCTSQAEAGLFEGDLIGYYENCMKKGETAFFVRGLPGAEGQYNSNLPLGYANDDPPVAGMDVEGFTFDPDAAIASASRCFIDQEEIFRTTGVALYAPRTVTIDVGVTGEGGPFAAVVITESSEEGSHVVANYNPGQKGAVQVSWPKYDKDTWTGIAVFESTDVADTYNDRDFSPYTDVSWIGTPDFDFEIALLCK